MDDLKPVPAPLPPLSPELHYDLDTFFSKKYQLRFPKDDFKLPPEELIYSDKIWTIPALQSLKSKLNMTKNKLNNLDLDLWHTHTRQMNPAKRITKFVTSNFQPEYGSGAWCKMTDMLWNYDVFPKIYEYMYKEGLFAPVPQGQRQDGIRSVHLSEAPGAFISATNHWFKTKFPGLQWSWSATTLNPYYEGNSTDSMINEDKLMRGSWSQWTFGADDTGDLLKRANIQHLIDNVGVSEIRLDPIILVTADGSIDCQFDPGEQELIVSQLQLAETVAALHLLEFSGSFVLKIFTFLECKTVCVLYFLSAVFQEVHLYKPVNSKEGNSEVYVICLGFQGTSSAMPTLDILLKEIENPSLAAKSAMFPLSQIPEAFVTRLVEAAELFVGKQIDAINRNLYTFKQDPSARRNMYAQLEPWKWKVVEKFANTCDLDPLPAWACLFSQPSLVGTSCLKSRSIHVDWKNNTGSFNDRALEAKQAKYYTYRDSIEKLWERLRPYEIQIRDERMNLKIHGFFGMYTNEFVYGKPYENIQSSRFLPSGPFQLRIQLREALRHPGAERYLGIGAIIPPEPHSCSNLVELQETLEHVLNSDRAYQNSDYLYRDRNLNVVKFCCHETITQILTLTDMAITRDRLPKLAGILLRQNKSGRILQHRQSLFLCEYPMFTRLHVGLILGALPLFREVRILYDIESQIHGILLHSYKGPPPTSSPIYTMLMEITNIGPGNNNSSRDLVLLETVPVHQVIHQHPGLPKRICDYNSVLSTHSMSQLLDHSLAGQRDFQDEQKYEYLTPNPRAKVQFPVPLVPRTTEPSLLSRKEEKRDYDESFKGRDGKNEEFDDGQPNA